MRKIRMHTGDNAEIVMAYFPVEHPKAVVQLVHGAKEHKERYYEFIHFLNENGYAACISDSRGHGESVNEKYPLGYMDDYRSLVKDQYRITRYLRKKNPGCPLYLFGHSLGSMIVRVYLENYDNQIDKLVLSGTANYIAAGKIGIFTAKILESIRGEKGYSRLLERFANFLDDTWVVGNPEALEKYRKDPLCTYQYPIASMREVFRINQELHRFGRYQVKNKELPILSVTGEKDPVTGGKKGLIDSVNTLSRLGYENIESMEYEGMYHEVLNETDKEMVYQDILLFFEEK